MEKEPIINIMNKYQATIIEDVDQYPSEVPFNPTNHYPEFKMVKKHVIGTKNNGVYEAIRKILLDSYPIGKGEKPETWNPFKLLVPEGGVVTIKPNMVRHWNENEHGSIYSVITHWSVVRPLIDYSLLAIGPKGKVFVGDAPHWDCDYDKLAKILSINTFSEYYQQYAPNQVHFIDFRPEWFESSGVVKTKHSIKLKGDPNGYVLFNLGEHSMFNDPKLDSKLFYGSGYDNKQTIEAHSNGKHEYLIAGSTVKCDLFINVPKLKTHHLLGLTVAMKNLVGINGDKNYLPHFRKGFIDKGGDQYPKKTLNLLIRYFILSNLLPILAKSYFLSKLWGKFLKIVHKRGGKNPYAGGAWIGNDTVWRMTLDLNRLLLFSDKNGSLDSKISRNTINIVDGIQSGEGEGPMCVDDKHTNLLIHSNNPLIADCVAAKLLGYQLKHLKLIQEGIKKHKFDLFPLRKLSKLQLKIINASVDSHFETYGIEDIRSLNFNKPIGWITKDNEK